MATNLYGQTPIDPRAELLIGRAMRQEPIMGAVPLLGRLAALGVGLRGQRSFEDQIAASRLQYSQALQAAGTNPSARIAALGAGLASPDPQIRMAAAEGLAAATAAETKLTGTPGGGTAAVPFVGGQVAGPATTLVEGRAEAPTLLKFNDGETERTLAFDPQTGGLIDLAKAPRETLQRVLPPDVYQQQIGLRTAAGEAQGRATAAGLAATMDKSAAQAQGGQQGRAEATIGMTQPLYQSAGGALLQAAAAVRANPTSSEARAAYEAARRAYATSVAQLRTPTEAVTQDGITDALTPLPDANTVATRGLVGSDPLRAAMKSIEQGLAGRGGPPLIVDEETPAATAEPAPPAPQGVDPALWEVMTPEERALWR